MTSSTPVTWWTALVARTWLGIQSLPRLTITAWRRSLQLRAVVISVVLSGVAIGAVGIYLSVVISQDLFSSRLNESLQASLRAQTVAQQIFDSADAATRSDVQGVVSRAAQSVRDASSTTMVGLLRVPGQDPSTLAPQDFISPELSNGVITLDMRNRVATGGNTQFWQSVELDTEQAPSPGLVVGSLVTIPAIGQYELYLGFDLAQAASTLSFIQSVLWISGLGLLILTGGVAWFVARLVVAPIRLAAQTSRKFAAGAFDERIPVQGQDVMATLAQSFNDMADSLQAQLRELGAISDVRERFVSDVSHELRTPLATMRLAVDVVYENRSKLTTANQRPVELLHTQMDRFESLLTDLLEISRYDSDSVVLEREPTNVVGLVNDVATSMRALAESRDSSLTVVSPGGHCEADVDPRRVRRILHNLIGNAVEHGGGKPITVEIDSSETAVAIVVEDFGVGMDQDEVAHIFERFWRGDPSRQRTLGGTGLGLAIAWEDARVHDGHIDVWAEAGRGARFRLTLPRHVGVAAGDSPVQLEPGDERAETS